MAEWWELARIDPFGTLAPQPWRQGPLGGAMPAQRTDGKIVPGSEPGKIGPPLPPHPLSAMGLLGSAYSLSPFAAGIDLADAYKAASSAGTFGELLPALGAGAMAALGAVPGARGPTKAAKALEEASRLAHAMPPASTPAELLTIEQALHTRPITIAANDRGFSGILADGRFKNVFETGHTGGFSNMDLRRDVEEALFGIPRNAPAERRPVYGAVGMAPTMVGVTGPGREGYGTHVFLMKPDINRRATWTAGDTIQNARAHLVPRPWAEHGGDAPAVRSARPYIEAQVWGERPRLDEVRGVLMTMPDKAAARALDKQRIPHATMPPSIHADWGSPEWADWWRRFGLAAPPLALGGAATFAAPSGDY